MKKFFLFCLLSSFTQYFAQVKKLDSLWNVYSNKSQSDTNRLKALNKIIFSYYCYSKPDSAILLTETLLKMAAEMKQPKFEAKAWINRGIAYSTKKDDGNTLDCYFKALNIANQMGNKEMEAGIFLNTGLVYYIRSDYPLALDYYLKSLQISEAIKDKPGIARCYNSIGNLYWKQLDYRKALDYLLKCLKAYEDLNNSLGIGGAYANIGNIYLDNGNYDKALLYFERALKIKIEIEDILGQAVCYLNMASVYSEKKDHEKAKLLTLKALKIYRETGNVGLIGICYNNLSGVMFNAKNFPIGLKYADSALKYSKEIDDVEMERKAYMNFANIYSSTGKYKEAYEAHVKFKQLTDTIFNIENSQELSDLKTQYEVSKKESEKQALAQQNQIQSLQLSQNRFFIWGLGGLALLILLTALLFILQTKYRNQQREMLLEQKLLRSQMNPHFIFNCLQAITNFTNDKKVEGYLSSFGGLTRSILESSRKDLVPLNKEIQLLENYFKLQKLLHEDRFNYLIKVAPEIDSENTSIPPMLAQPFIENAIEHGFRNIKSGGEIELSFNLVNSNLILEIRDNGIGINNTNQSGRSLATTITTERIQLFNKKSKRKASFNIAEAFPLETNKGVKVTFSIPI